MYERIHQLSAADLETIAAQVKRSASGRGNVVYLPETDSTNAWARREFESQELPCVFLTDHQTAGRGRHGRSWVDQPGESALMSIVVEAPPREYRSLAPLITGEATARAIEAHLSGVRVDLKWPNDLLIDNRKVGGLLVEAISNDSDGVLIVGIGINVSQVHFDGDFRHDPTSLRIASGRQPLRAELVRSIVANVIEAFRTPRHWSDHLPSYLTRMSKIDARARFETGTESLSGVIRGVAPDGALLLETEDGVRHFYAGDISSR